MSSKLSEYLRAKHRGEEIPGLSDSREKRDTSQKSLYGIKDANFDGYMFVDDLPPFKVDGPIRITTLIDDAASAAIERLMEDVKAKNGKAAALFQVQTAKLVQDLDPTTGDVIDIEMTLVGELNSDDLTEPVSIKGSLEGHFKIVSSEIHSVIKKGKAVCIKGDINEGKLFGPIVSVPVEAKFDGLLNSEYHE